MYSSESSILDFDHSERSPYPWEVDIARLEKSIKALKLVSSSPDRPHPFGQPQPAGEFAESPVSYELPPGETDVKLKNWLAFKRYHSFWIAAKYIAAEFAGISQVVRVVLFGSVASRLKKEIPEEKTFRRFHVRTWHLCRNLDLSVWLTGKPRLKTLVKVRDTALAEMSSKENIQIPSKLVNIHLFDSENNQYIGCLCPMSFNSLVHIESNKDDYYSENMLLPGKNPIIYKDTLAPHKTKILFNRSKDIENGDDQLCF